MPLYIGRILSLLVPFFNFGFMFLDISVFTTGELDVSTQTYIPGPGKHFTLLSFLCKKTKNTLTGFAWSDLSQPIPTTLLPQYPADSGLAFPTPPNPIQAWINLGINMALYALLLCIADMVIPDENGTQRVSSWIHFLTFQRSLVADSSAWLEKTKKRFVGLDVDGDEDEDVNKQRKMSLSGGWLKS
jgi:hypothetical protein